MSNATRITESSDSIEYHRHACEIVIRMLDLSINSKSNILHAVVSAGEEISEEKTVFSSVYDYLHNSDWRVSIPQEISTEDVKIVDKLRSSPSRVAMVEDACKGSIMKELDLIHNLNCELFFTRMDHFMLPHTPAYFYFDNADSFHKAIANSDFSTAQEVPDKVKPEMEKHMKIRTLWAKRRNPQAKCKVLAVLHYDAMPKEIITFHSRAE